MRFRKIRFLFLILFILFGRPLLGQSIAYKTVLEGIYDKSFPVVKPAQITDISHYQILDAREMVEFDISHLPGAKWVGYETFTLKNVEDLDKNKPVLIYCTVGARSQEIGKKLQSAGFSRVFNLYGGIIHWVNENKQVETSGIPTQKVHTYSKTWGIWLKKGEKVY
jgi:rhodanese-related sulfurtransferase